MDNRAFSPPSQLSLPLLATHTLLSSTDYYVQIFADLSCWLLCVLYRAEKRVSVVLTTYDLAIRDLALLRKQGAGSDRYLMLLALSLPFFLPLSNLIRWSIALHYLQLASAFAFLSFNVFFCHLSATQMGLPSSR